MLLPDLLLLSTQIVCHDGENCADMGVVGEAEERDTTGKWIWGPKRSLWSRSLVFCKLMVESALVDGVRPNSERAFGLQPVCENHRKRCFLNTSIFLFSLTDF